MIIMNNFKMLHPLPPPKIPSYATDIEYCLVFYFFIVYFRKSPIIFF